MCQEDYLWEEVLYPPLPVPPNKVRRVAKKTSTMKGYMHAEKNPVTDDNPTVKRQPYHGSKLYGMTNNANANDPTPSHLSPSVLNPHT